MGDRCYVRRIYRETESGNIIYVQTSEWYTPDGGLEAHPEWDAGRLRSSTDIAAVIERRPWPNPEPT